MIAFAEQDQEDRLDPLIYVFPRMTKVCLLFVTFSQPGLHQILFFPTLPPKNAIDSGPAAAPKKITGAMYVCQMSDRCRFAKFCDAAVTQRHFVVREGLKTTFRTLVLKAM